MQSNLLHVNDLKSISERFEALINKVPKSEEEAEFIVSAVEKLVSEHPSLQRCLELDREEKEALLFELQKFL